MATNEELACKTIEVLEKDGWGKSWYTSPTDGKHCLVGAMYEARGALEQNPYISSEHPLYVALVSHLELDADVSLEEWNDNTTRKEEEVINLLREFC